ncbi:hypothetical protein E6C60_2397 [Paenibacillus algicola]|uniref:Uncharacterized protein n=1 Tax=Paenibacillus algicola TaxID=2565926 RepID=A0A4P8XRJ3_9BACL|nr:hypothetical protein E6C60_2397 [Paenibacillus algicola]
MAAPPYVVSYVWKQYYLSYRKKRPKSNGIPIKISSSLNFFVFLYIELGLAGIKLHH